MSLAMRLLIALVAGIAAGIAIAASGSETAKHLAIAIEPAGTLFVNAIRMTVVPLVVGSLIAGIAATADLGAVKRIGGRAFVLAILVLIAGSAFAALAGPPLLAGIPLDAAAAALHPTSSTPPAAPPTFTQWLVDLVPVNPVRAASDGAMLPLIIFTLLFALALTRIETARRTVVLTFFEGVTDAATVLARWILAFAPLGVFALALPLAVRLGVAAAGAIAGFLAIVVGLSAAFALIVLYPLPVILGRRSFGEFARAALPAQAVAMSARSSLAALPAMIEAASERLRLPPEISGVVLPLAASTFRAGATVGQTVSALFVARLYGVTLSPAAVWTIALTTIATSFSVPGIPGGSIIAMVPVLSAAGVPAEGVGILLGIDTIPDMMRTTVNVTGDLSIAACLRPRPRGDAPAEV